MFLPMAFYLYWFRPSERQEGHQVLAWLSVWSEVQLIAYGSADATAIPSSRFSKIQNGLSFWYRPAQVVLEKRPLNVCVCVCVS